MSIVDKEAYQQYLAHDSHYTVYATAANQSWDALAEIAAELGLKVPNTDAAENVVVEIFKMLWDHNNQ